MKLYEITNDMLALQDLLENAVDENGNPRELTDNENETIKKWFEESKADFENKFDNYGRFIANLKIQAETADNERKAYKEELDRLSQRAKSFENRRKSVIGGLRYAMEILGMQKYKTALFSAGIQNTQISIQQTGSINGLPEEFLKPREFDATKIKAAIKNGALVKTDGGTILLAKTGEILEGIHAEQGTALVMR